VPILGENRNVIVHNSLSVGKMPEACEHIEGVNQDKTVYRNGKAESEIRQQTFGKDWELEGLDCTISMT
jgi:hypothetical protein